MDSVGLPGALAGANKSTAQGLYGKEGSLVKRATPYSLYYTKRRDEWGLMFGTGALSIPHALCPDNNCYARVPRRYTQNATRSHIKQNALENSDGQRCGACVCFNGVEFTPKNGTSFNPIKGQTTSCGLSTLSLQDRGQELETQAFQASPVSEARAPKDIARKRVAQDLTNFTPITQGGCLKPNNV